MFFCRFRDQVLGSSLGRGMTVELLWRPFVADPATLIKSLLGTTLTLHSSSFLGLPYRILNINHKKQLLWSLWVDRVRSITP